MGKKIATTSGVAAYLSTIGAKGGAAGKGAAKRRSKKHYQEIGRAGARARYGRGKNRRN